MTRIAEVFRKGRKVLIAYITAGYPTPAETPDLVAALERGGVDLIELGVPFSDPVADGPVIQATSQQAIEAGTTLSGVLEIARIIRKTSQIPLMLFTYMNPAVKYGFEALARDAKESGIDGVLLTDLSVEEADTWVEVMRKAGLDTIFLAAPTSSDHRLDLVAKYSTGFIYVVSRTGVTGEQEALSSAAAPLLQKLKGRTSLPLALGFGISNGLQAGEAARYADGVVVGSAIMKMIQQGRNLEAFAQELRKGMDEV